MPTLYEYYEDDCPWLYFDSSYKTLLGACVIVSGVFGVLLNGWLFITFLHSHLLTARCHILILNLCTACLGRNLLGFPFAGSSALAKRWLFGSACCKLFAFFNQFLGVFQVAALFVICLERYLQVKNYLEDKELSLRSYCGLVGSCWLYAAVLSVPPLLGYGKYSCDVTRTICTLCWPSVEDAVRHFGYNVPYVVLGGFLPICAIFYFIIKTIPSEKRYYRSQQLKQQHHLTKSLHSTCVITIMLWVPAAMLVGWQWLPLLIYGYRMHVPPALVLLAPIASEAACCVPVLCYLCGAGRERAALLGRVRRHYALLRPDRARRYAHT
ncbi:Visual pigment-like receptor peropsin [Eumeta japonica]|uniref:Visual pigment-like receptor peropsin n=1 Tax=Eumeta variegata TaxID=151549 RepID=A0A4C1UYX5_EUMVA|nr:Visual pigment-like receptor peropsin [Eumeta japonica]